MDSPRPVIAKRFRHRSG